MALKKLTFYPQNSQFVLVTGLQDQGTTPSTYVNNATLTGTLKDGSGNAVPGATNIAGSYVASSNGNYIFPLDPSNFNPVTGFDYTFVIDGSYPSNKKFHAEIPSIVKIRNQGTET